MGILPKPDGKQRELYNSRDRELIEKRDFYWSQAEQYPLLEDVIRGRAKLSDRALELQQEFETAFPSVVRLIHFSGYLKKPFSIPYTDELVPFVDMLSDLTEPFGSFDYKDLLTDIFLRYSAARAIETSERLRRFFLSVICSAVLLDKKIHRHFMDELVQENPEVFKDEYRRMNTEEREYAEYTLSRMLGAGILKDVDEIELERIILEARE